MNKILLAIFLIIFPPLIFSQTHQIDSVVIRRCGTNTTLGTYRAIDSIDVNGLLMSTTSWYDTLGTPGSREEFTYSSTHKLLHDVVCDYYNSVCLMESDLSWQYNSHDSLLSYVRLWASAGSVYYGYGDLYAYDSLNRMTEYTHQKYDDSLSMLVSDFRTLYTYDTVNNINIEIRQNYIDSLGLWINYSRSTIYLDSSARKSKVIREFWISPGTFGFSSALQYYYLANGSIDFYSMTGSGSGGDSTVFQNIYSSQGNLVQSSESIWSAGSMDIINKLTNYYYDTNLNMIASGYSSWDGVSFGRCDTTINSYDLVNRLTTYYHSAVGSCGHGGQSGWNAFGPTGILDSSNYCEWTMGQIVCRTCSYEYISLVSGISYEVNESGISVFPNPANDEITISFKYFIHPISFVIRDNLGRAVKSGIIENEKSILSVSDLSPGFYFLNILNDVERLASRKFIVE